MCIRDSTSAATTNVHIAQEGDLPSDYIGMQDSDTQNVVDEMKASVTSFQSQLKQTLSRISGLTYTVTNVGFTKKALDTLRTRQTICGSLWYANCSLVSQRHADELCNGASNIYVCSEDYPPYVRNAWPKENDDSWRNHVHMVSFFVPFLC